MGQVTLRHMREVIMELIDTYKPSESRIHPNVVDQWIFFARNFIRARDVNKDTAKQMEMDSDWFTEHVLPILWDSQGAYVELNQGSVSLPYNQGIRVMPVSGLGNPFVWLPTGWCMNSPELSYAEGNIVCEEAKGKVRFPAMNRADGWTEVRVFVIEDSTETDEDEPLAMPSDYQMAVADMVLQKLGIAKPEDRLADSKPLNAV